MAAKVTELSTHEELGHHVKAAAEATGYKDGFGVVGCDLSKPIWWAIYCRQSLDEQGNNNRLPDYLRTCAMEAKKLAVVVPREYVFLI